MIRSIVMGALVLLCAPISASAQSCTGNPVAVQVLGSGGPAINPERASASYLLWVGDQAKMLVDMGGGAFLRFGQSRAKLSDLALAAVSHLHPDHVSDLPALLWLSHQTRREPLPIVGPSGNATAPDFQTFLGRLFDEKDGAFRVLGPVLGAPQGPTGGGVRLEVSVVDVTKPEAATVYDRQGFTVTAFGIPHSTLPMLAYRVETQGVSAVFSSDQNGSNPKFIDFARGANVLVMHMAIPPGPSTATHASPADVGRIAQAAGIGRLIVSHIGRYDLDAAVAELKKSYAGPLTVGADLQCTPAR